jgi:hypothetical protein
MRYLLGLICIFILTIGRLAADTVVASNPDGSSSTISDVTLLGILTDPGTGQKLARLRFPDGNVVPVEFSRIVSMDFPVGRPGQLLVGGDSATAQRYNATIRAIRNQQLEAIPAGETQAYAIPLANIYGFTSENVAPISTPTLPNAAGGGASGDFFSSGGSTVPPSGSDFFDTPPPAQQNPFANQGGTGPGTMGDEAGEDLEYSGSFLDSMTPEERAEYDEAMGELSRNFGLAIGVVAIYFVVIPIALVTYVWLLINAFSTGKTGWGVGILIFGCLCLFVKPFYLSHYEGRGKTAVSILVYIEVILLIAERIITKVFIN